MLIHGKLGNYDEVLKGTDADEEFKGFGGADRIHGGYGIDTATYVDSPSGVSIGLGYGYNVGGLPGWGGSAEGNQLFDIENIAGSAHNDTLSGNNGFNELWGNSGHDTLLGMGGIDTLHGGSGNDTLSGGADADILNG